MKERDELSVWWHHAKEAFEALAVDWDPDDPESLERNGKALADKLAAPRIMAPAPAPQPMDTAPKDGTPILVQVNDGDGTYIYPVSRNPAVSRNSAVGFWTDINDGIPIVDPACWWHLPEATRVRVQGRKGRDTDND